MDALFFNESRKIRFVPFSESKGGISRDDNELAGLVYDNLILMASKAGTLPRILSSESDGVVSWEWDEMKIKKNTGKNLSLPESRFFLL